MFKRFLCLLALAMFAAAPLSADVRADSVLLAYDASSSTKLPPPRWWGEAGSGVSIQSLDDRPTLSFEREDTGGNLLIHARVRLPEGAEAVQTTLDARASEITGGKKPHHGATVVLIFEDDAKKPVGYGNIRADAGGDGIANFAKTHPVPAGATHVKLSMGLWQVAGRFDVAAFSIAVPEPEPAEPASAPAAIDGPLHELRIDPSVDAGGFKKLVREVNDRLDRGVGVRVVFAPGVYRLPVNTLVFEGEPGGSADAPLVLEAEAPDTVFLRGSVERSAEFDPSPGNWSPVEGHRGVYAIDWPYRFEKSIGYWAHRYGFPFRRESMRRELLAINGQMMLPRELEKYVWEDPDGPFFSNDKKAGNRPGRYVADGLVDGGLSVLRPGEFAVADRPGTPAPLGRKLFVKLPKGMTWGDVERVEFGAIGAGDEDALIRVANRNNVELRNLTVEHMPGDMLSEGVMLYGVNGFRVEGCDISRNGGRGLVMSRVADGVIT
ncbi:MAG: right-handed parallel beta-helix repeat-containing protein, partial [Planctomycetota bacterium]